MKDLILYIHGKGGNAGEGEHYKKFFPEKFLDEWLQNLC